MYTIVERKAYGIWDEKQKIWLDVAIDLANNDEAKIEMELKLKELNK